MEQAESMASKVSDENKRLALSVMLAVSDVPTAVEWYRRALGAVELWSMGGVAALQIAGAPFLLGEPAGNCWDTPLKLGMASARVEVFCDSPDAFIARALREGAKGGLDDIKDHKRPWGIHRQGGFIDPFGHIWLVGDKSPLDAFPKR
jgi:PhnB protein